MTDFLNSISLRLNELIKLLENIFDSLNRSNNLISYLKNYALTFEKQMLNFKEILLSTQERLDSYQEQLGQIERIVIETRRMADQIEDSANNFARFARKIAYLAENVEIKAHQARDEGRGLVVVAREVHTIAKSTQSLFQHFDELLKIIRKNVEPVSEEIGEAIKIASITFNNLIEFLSSLRTIGESIESLQKFIRSMETGGEIFSQLETKIKEHTNVIREQLESALKTIDDISIKGSEIYNLSQILYELYNLTNTRKYDKIYAVTQFNHMLRENIEILKRINVEIKPPMVSSELLGELHKIIKQTKNLYELVINNKSEIGVLNDTVNKLTGFKIQMNQLFSNFSIIENKIKDFSRILREQIRIMEDIILECSKVMTKLKTLAILSQLEHSHSIKARGLMTPIIMEFQELLNNMDSSFKILGTGIRRLKNVSSEFEAVHLEKEFTYISLPDFSSIRIFFDDTLRVFEECNKREEDLKELIDKLDRENFLVQQYWNVYNESLRIILNFQNSLQKFIQKELPVFEVKKTPTTVKINLFNDPVTLRPDKKTDATSQQVIVNYSTGLFQFGMGTGVIPALCDEYFISDDGKDYIFHLRDNLRYSNGKRLDIDDIKLGIIKGLDGPNHNLLEMIDGARDYLKFRDVDLLRIKIIDQHRIQVRLQYPYLPFLASFATNVADPYIDQDLPSGTGPFKLIAWNRGKEIVLEANEYYFEGRPAVDQLYFIITVDEDYGYELFKKGELSIYQPGQKSLRRIKEEFPDLIIKTPELSVQFLCFNCQKPPFNNRLVRQAICYGIDNEKMVKDLLGDTAIPARGIFPPSMPVYNKRLNGYKYDPDMSRRLLSQAGFNGGLPDTYPLDISDSPASIKRAEFIKANLQEIGIKVEINPLPWHDFLEKTYQGNFLLCFQGWISDTGDPDNFLYPLFHTNSFGYSGNTFFFSNPEIDKMIENARQIRSIKQRNNYYQQLEEMILNEAPGVFLFHSLKNLVVRRDIRGFKSHPLSIIRAKYIRTYSVLESKDFKFERLSSQFINV